MGSRFVPPAFIDQLLERADIAEIIGKRVRLKRSGSVLVGLCPFHQEKTPSFTVYPQRQFYHCFGCQVGGSVLNFLQRFDNLQFLDAVELLAGIVGLPMPQPSAQHPQNAQASRLEQQKWQERERLLSINQQLLEYFQRCLQHNSAALQYLQRRGINSASCQRYAIGYAPEQCRWLMQHTGVGKDWRREELVELGILVSKRGFCPRFKKRIIFPIRDGRGRVLGFGGRTIINDPAKYLNSPETPLYHKSECWYGLYEARPRRNKNSLLVVEGYLDVISLAQYGVEDAVASCGTAVNTAQLRQLLKRAKNITFCFDGDSAGRRAAWLALQRALPLVQDGQFRFLFLPQGEDPDTLIRKWQADRFYAWSDQQAVNLDDFLLNHLQSQHDMHTVTGKHAFLKELMEYLKLLPRGIFYQLLLERVSELVQIDVGSFMQDLMPTGPTTFVVPRLPVGQIQLTARHELGSTRARPARTKAEAAAATHSCSRLCHPLIQQLFQLLVYHPELARTLVAIYQGQALCSQFLGGEALYRLAQWMSQLDSGRLHLGRITEYLSGQPLELLLQQLLQATPNLTVDATEQQLQQQLTNIISVMRQQLDQKKISEMIVKLDQQQLGTEEKRQLQQLIRRTKQQRSSPEQQLNPTEST